jgi:hypothetical protein
MHGEIPPPVAPPARPLPLPLAPLAQNTVVDLSTRSKDKIWGRWPSRVGSVCQRLRENRGADRTFWAPRRKRGAGFEDLDKLGNCRTRP